MKFRLLFVPWPILLLALLLVPGNAGAIERRVAAPPHDHPVPAGTWHPRGTPGSGEEWEEDLERMTRVVETQLPPEKQRRALAETGLQEMLRRRTSQVGGGKRQDQWVRMGPVGGFGSPRRNGRISGIQLVPDGSGGYQLFAGACQGGIWTMRSQTFAHWLDIGRNLPNPSVRAFAVDPDNYQRLIVATGDFLRFKGTGMYETLDGGTTWQALSLPSDYGDGIPSYFYKLLYLGPDPYSGYKRWVVAGDWGPIYSVNDGGLWSCGLDQTSGVPLMRRCTDMVAVPGQPGRVWAALCDRRLVNSISGVYLSEDYGETWQRFHGGELPPAETWDRATLAICRDHPDNLAVAVTGPDNTLTGVYRTTDGGDTWSDLGQEGFGGGQASHTLSLVIKPDDPDWMILGTVGLSLTTDGGDTWASPGFAQGHADVTHLEFNDLTGTDILWICNDGGLYYHDFASGETYDALGDDIDGLCNSEIDFMDAKRLIRGIGLQDNGIVYSNNGANLWQHLIGGDGADFEITDSITGEAYFVNGIYSPPTTWHTLRFDGSSLHYDIDSLEAYMYRLVYSHELDKLYSHDGTNLYYLGGSGNWVTMVTDLQPDPYSIRSIYGNRGQDDALWVTYWHDEGSNEGDEDLTFVYRDGATWITRHMEDFNSSGHPVHTVFASREWPGEAWVGLENPGSPDKIWHTTDSGQTWQNITGNLTSVGVINTIEVLPFDPETIFVGTNQGIYRTTDGGAYWEPYMEGLPIGRCSEMKFVEDSDLGTAHSLVLAMDGRGLWKRDIALPPIVYVDARNTSGLADGSFEDPFPTVAQGISTAPSGSIIAIHSDTYYEPQNIARHVKLVTWAGPSRIR